MRFRHVILDRDGVLNVEVADHGYVTVPAEWCWIPGALEALSMLQHAGVRVSVATNQSGVGRGLMTAAALEAVHARMLEDAERAGARIARIYTCPHAPDDRCQCRKPAPGLIRQAIAESGIGPDETLVVGDDLRDLTAARTAGVRAALVLTGKGRSVTAPLPEVETPVYDDLRTLALHLLAEGHIQGDSSK